MANKRNWLDEHIRGIYVKRQRFPVHYSPPARQRATLSFKVPPPEAMVKVAFYVKSPTGAKNVAHYIAHGSEGMEKDARVYDDERRLIPTEKLNETIDAYDLEQRRKNGNAMVHLIVSFPKRMNVSEDEAYRFIERYMEPFAERGYRYLYAVHTHQSATHGHILLKMSNGRERLRFKKAQLQMLRQHQVEVAKEFGWEIQATRFQDRDFSLTQMVIPRKHKTIRQLRELHERRRSVERTDWTVSGGNMIFATAPAENAQIVIMRKVPLTQETDYRENEILPAETLERNFDKLTMQVQQLKEQANRAVTVDIFDDTDAPSLIPSIRQAVSDCAGYAAIATQKAQTATTQAQNAEASATNAENSETHTAAMLETKANIAADNLSQQGKSNLIALSSLAMNRVVDYIFGTLTDTMQYYTTPVNGYIHIEYDGNNEVYFSANGVAFGTAGSTVGAARRLTSPLFKKGTVVGAQVASGTVVLPHNFFNYANGEV